MFQPLDGPSKSGVLSGVDTTTPVEVKVGATPYDERKVITLQGDGKFYIYFADESETVTQANIQARGFVQFKNAKESYEAGPEQRVYVLAFSGTVDIRLSERG